MARVQLRRLPLPHAQCRARDKCLIHKNMMMARTCDSDSERLFGLHRAGYFGLTRIPARVAIAAIGQNLLSAANKIARNPQTPAIA